MKLATANGYPALATAAATPLDMYIENDIAANYTSPVVISAADGSTAIPAIIAVSAATVPTNGPVNDLSGITTLTDNDVPFPVQLTYSYTSAGGETITKPVTLNITSNGLDFIFTKVGDENVPLPDVEFMLYKWDTAANGGDMTTGIQAISGADGKVTFQQLIPGDYLIEETKAADGYSLPSGQWKINLDDSAQAFTITAIGNPPAFSQNGTDYQLRNYKPMTMPVTGGFGKPLSMVGGVMLIGWAVIIFILKTKEKDEKN